MGWLRRRSADQRARILAAVQAHPGANLEAIRRCAGVSCYALGRHLAELRADGDIWRATHGGYYAKVWR